MTIAAERFHISNGILGATLVPQAVTSQQQATFAKARAACLEGRGYTVK